MQANDLFSLQLRLTKMMMETQSVMALRIMGMSGVIPFHHGENARMVHEKGPAMAAAFTAATKAVWAGARPDEIFSAALAPVSDQVSANRKRLTA